MEGAGTPANGLTPRDCLESQVLTLKSISHLAIPAGKAVAFGAATVSTFKAEYGLALAAGATEPWAIAFPVATTVYSAVSLATNKMVDAIGAVALMVVCQALASLVSADIIEPDWWLVIIVACIPVAILARVQSLRPRREPSNQRDPAAVEERNEPTGHPQKRQRRKACELRADAERLLQENPDLQQRELARLLDVSDRRLRVVLNGK